MSLVSLTFIIFLLILMLMYYLLPKSWQWVILLCGSVCFYILSSTWWTIGYVIISVVTIYLGTLLMEKAPKYKKGIYIVTLLINLGLMCTLKFTSLIPSLGISFYALQMIGYLTDCYWGMSEREKNIGKVALFNIYFPQMVSGPISRYRQIGPQLIEAHSFDGMRIRLGVYRIFVGFFKKLMVSEHLSALTDYLFKSYESYGGIFIWIGTGLYVVQLYADFSGCMDIVLGASECFGITLPENFNRPFEAVSIQEIWQRWHITLGTFLKDYVMYPILRTKAFTSMTTFIKTKWGKKAAKNIPTILSMLVLWLCMGIWHGFGFNFVGEGLWFWAIIAISTLLAKTFKRTKDRLHIDAKSPRWMAFCRVRTAFLFAIGMLFFKAASLKAAISMLISAFNPMAIKASCMKLLPALVELEGNIGANNIVWPAVAVIIGIIFMTLLSNMEAKDKSVINIVASLGFKRRLVVLWVLFIMIVLLGAYGPGYSASEFIYGGF